VQYTIRIVGPATSALIPVHVSMVASVGGLQILNLGPEDPDEIPIEASAAADVVLSYANDLENVPTLPDVIATNNYDYHFFLGTGVPAPETGAQTQSFDGVVMMAPNEDIDVLVSAQASAEFADQFADQGVKVSDSAAADPIQNRRCILFGLFDHRRAGRFGPRYGRARTCDLGDAAHGVRRAQWGAWPGD
jgi:hypothetical protein